MQDGPSKPPASETWPRRLVAFLKANRTVSLVAIAALALGLYIAFRSVYRSEAGQAWAAVEAVRDGLQAGDAAAVLANISPDFSEEGLGKGQLGRWLREVLKGHAVSRLYVNRRSISISGSSATLRVSAHSYHNHGLVRSEWTVVLEKEQRRWMIRRATPITMNDRRLAGLRDVLAQGYY